MSNDNHKQTVEPITVSFEEKIEEEIEEEIEAEQANPADDNSDNDSFGEERFGDGDVEDSYEEDNYEEDYDDYDEGLDDEEEKLPPLAVAGVFLGLVALAAIICGILWSFTHRDKQNDKLVNATETIQDISAEASENEGLENETLENITQDIMTGDEAAGGGESGVKEPDENGQMSDAIDVQTDTAEDERADSVAEENTVQEPVSGNESMEFTEVSDTVTAKDVTNLRSVPSTLDAENVVAQLLNGETLGRTGVNDATGWSRLDYNGQTVYAVTGYLTTDLTYRTPVAAADPNRITTQYGRVIIFTNCDDYITPKEYVNLRVEPSTSQGEATVKCQISNGSVVHRTGCSPDSGWSRVEYNGEILYVVSSMVYNTDAATE